MMSWRSVGRKRKLVEKVKPRKPREYKKFKVACAGEIATGKTTFVYKFTTGDFIEEDTKDVSLKLLSSDGWVLTKILETEDYCVQLEIHDTAEAERNNNLTQFYYRNTTILLLFFSLTSRESFEELEETLIRCSGFGVPQQAVRVLVGTKSDCERQREVEQCEIDDFAVEHGLTYFATSSRSNTNIYEVFNYAVGELFRRLEAGRFNEQDELLATMTWTPEREEAEKATGEGDTTTEEGAGSGPIHPAKRGSELSGSEDKKEGKTARSTSVGPDKVGGGKKKKDKDKDRRYSEKVMRAKGGRTHSSEGT